MLWILNYHPRLTGSEIMKWVKYCVSKDCKGKFIFDINGVDRVVDGKVVVICPMCHYTNEWIIR